MCHNNMVMQIKFYQNGIINAWVIALELICKLAIIKVLENQITWHQI